MLICISVQLDNFHFLPPVVILAPLKLFFPVNEFCPILDMLFLDTRVLAQRVSNVIVLENFLIISKSM